MVNGQYRDSEEDEPTRRRKAPKALARMRREFPYEKRLAVFKEVFGREPASDEELDAFAEDTSESSLTPATKSLNSV